MNALRRASAAIRRLPALPGRAEVLVLVCTACLVAFYYLARADRIGVYSPLRGWSSVTADPLTPVRHFAAAALLLGAVPVACARWLLGVRLQDLGLGLGRWREGLVSLAVGAPLAVLAGWIGSRSVAMRAVYPLDPTLTANAASFGVYAALQFLYYGAWEVLFRGVLLFGLAPRLGAAPANATQTALSVTAHFGRALDETGAALGAGFLFGWIALRTRSIWYLAAIHWLVGVSQDWFILAR